MSSLSVPKCDEANEFTSRMLRGETRGALGYVVPLLNPEVQVPDYSREECEHDVAKFVEKGLAGLARRRWGHDHGVPMFDPTRHGTDPVASTFGSRYYYDPVGTIPCIETADEMSSLSPDKTLDDGLFPAALETVEFVAERLGDRMDLMRYHAGDHLASAGMIVRNTELLAGMYTHPEAVHRLLDQCNELLISFFKQQKRIAPKMVMNSVYDMYWPDGAGNYSGSDFLALISPTQALEFAIPYINRMSDAFGGILVHSCGEWAHQFEVIRDNVHNLRAIWLNAGECSFDRAVDVFSGTDVVIVTRWALNNNPYHFDSRLDFVKQMLASKTPDVSVFLQAHPQPAQWQSDPDLEEESSPNAVSEEILQVIERYVREGVLD